MIEIRMKAPGGQNWIVQDFTEVFRHMKASECYMVRSQKEKDVLDGYALVHGVSMQFQVGDFTLAYGSPVPYLFLWVVEIEELT